MPSVSRDDLFLVSISLIILPHCLIYSVTIFLNLSDFLPKKETFAFLHIFNSPISQWPNVLPSELSFPNILKAF